MRGPVITRRTVLAGVACSGLLPVLGLMRHAAALTPHASAGHVHDRLLKTLVMDMREQIRFGEELERNLIGRAGGPYSNTFAQTALMDFARPLFAASVVPSLPWTATIAENDMPAAWVLPGGRMVLYKGLFRYIDTADELAAVIAHLMGHAEGGHLVEIMREPAFAHAIPPRGADAILRRLEEDSGLGPADPVIAHALETAVFKTVRSGYGPAREAAADQAMGRIFVKTGHNAARGAVVFETIARLAPPDADATTCLFGGHAGLAQRMQTLRSLTANQGSVWPANAGFDILKQTFPARRHYRPMPVLKAPL